MRQIVISLENGVFNNPVLQCQVHSEGVTRAELVTILLGIANQLSSNAVTIDADSRFTLLRDSQPSVEITNGPIS